MDTKIVARFRVKVNTSASTPEHAPHLGPCWEWTASRLKAGYGQFWIAGSPQLAHRVAWTIEHGDVPAGQDVLHRCDNPSCVRPDHLFVGTHAENMADRDRKGRNAHGEANGARRRPERLARGAANGRAKLTESDVIEIRAARATGERLSVLAERFGVSAVVISGIARGAIWRHVKT